MPHMAQRRGRDAGRTLADVQARPPRATLASAADVDCLSVPGFLTSASACSAAWSGWADPRSGCSLRARVVAIVIARLLTPDEYGLAALALVFASLVLVFSDLALGAALIQRKDAHRRRPRHGVLDHASAAAWSSRCSASRSPGRSRRCTGSRTRSRCCWRCRSRSCVTALGAHAAVADAARHGLPARRGAAADRRARRRRSAAVRRRGRRRRVGDHRPAARSPRRSRRSLVLAALRRGGRASRSRARACATSAASASTCSATGCSTTSRPTATASSSAASSAPPALGAYAVAYNTMLVPASKHRRPAAARVLARLLAHPGRARADRRRVGARRPADRARSRCRRSAAWWSSPPTSCRSCSATSGTRPCPVIQILAWVGIIQALQAINMDILMARGRARTMFRFSLVADDRHMIAFAVGLQWGVVGVAAAYAISTHAGRARPDRARGARARRLADGVRARRRGRVPGRGRHVLAVAGAAQLALVDAGVAPRRRLVLCIWPACSSTACVPVACPRAGVGGPGLLDRRGRAGVPLVAAPADA